MAAFLFWGFDGVYTESRTGLEPLMLVDRVQYQIISTLVAEQRCLAAVLSRKGQIKGEVLSLAEKKGTRYSGAIHADLSSEFVGH